MDIKKGRGTIDLNNPDAENWFKTEQSKSNKIEYLQQTGK